MYKYLVGLFDDEEPLLAAVRSLKNEGVKIHDAVTPFPVHGLEHALGCKETKLHTAGFLFGAFGTTLALSVMTLASVVDWPNNFGGKPAFALPSFIPITFELTVLCASIGMVVAYYLRNNFSVFADTEVYDERLTSDRFGVIFNLADFESEEEQEKLVSKLRSLGVVETKIRETRNYKPNYDEQAP